MSELRHDFRHYYHVSYDDIDPEEAIDLIRALPSGTLYRRATDPELAWSDEYAALMDVKELVSWCLMRLNGNKDELPPMVVRPADIVRAKQASEKARRTREKLEHGNWEAV